VQDASVTQAEPDKQFRWEGPCSEEPKNWSTIQLGSMLLLCAIHQVMRGGGKITSDYTVPKRDQGSRCLRALIKPARQSICQTASGDFEPRNSIALTMSTILLVTETFWDALGFSA
jgi:hypothetical protein